MEKLINLARLAVSSVSDETLEPAIYYSAGEYLASVGDNDEALAFLRESIRLSVGVRSPAYTYAMKFGT